MAVESAIHCFCQTTFIDLAVMSSDFEVYWSGSSLEVNSRAELTGIILFDFHLMQETC